VTLKTGVMAAENFTLPSQEYILKLVKYYIVYLSAKHLGKTENKMASVFIFYFHCFSLSITISQP